MNQMVAPTMAHKLPGTQMTPSREGWQTNREPHGKRLGSHGGKQQNEGNESGIRLSWRAQTVTEGTLPAMARVGWGAQQSRSEDSW